MALVSLHINIHEIHHFPKNIGLGSTDFLHSGTPPVPFNTLQDTLKKLYAASSIIDRGTVCQLQDDFSHRNVSTDVMKSLNYTDNFIRLTTEAHIV